MGKTKNKYNRVHTNKTHANIAPGTKKQVIRTATRMNASKRKQRNGIALVILYLTGLVYVLIHAFSFLSGRIAPRTITTLSMAIFSLAAGILSWFEILPFKHIAQFLRDNLPAIYVALLYVSLIVAGACYFCANTEMQEKLAGDMTNVLTWVAIMSMYFIACASQLRSFLTSDNG